MVIMNAERFGLSQLHQLRGRVGRGGDQSYCFLMTDYNLNLDGRKRMEIMTSTSDGFVIAEADLKMRGPGDISGTRQSGDIQLKLANISQDAPILQQAQQLSKKIVEEDPELQMEQFKPLKHFIEKLKKQSQRWGKIS
jgi:ATP-dependent DNA helicase RecG